MDTQFLAKVEFLRQLIRIQTHPLYLYGNLLAIRSTEVWKTHRLRLGLGSKIIYVWIAHDYVLITTRNISKRRKDKGTCQSCFFIEET